MTGGMKQLTEPSEPEQRETALEELKLQQAERTIERIARARKRILDELGKVIVGQQDVIDQILIGLYCRGHCLVVGVPGLAKTLIVKSLAGILDLEFKRIQFTPDLMPSDITGTEILEEDPSTRQRSFKFIPGPVFTNVLLADEINRTPPKTQAALLEAMQEYHVTVAGKKYPIPLPFLVLATQNPIEQEGTYPLPEAQLDRFMLNILIDYPPREDEIAIVQTTTGQEEVEPDTVLSGKDVITIQQIVRRVPVSRHVTSYATDLVRSSRPRSRNAPQFINDWVNWGAGPRATQCLVLAAKARAVIEGRYNVSCNDIRAVAHPVLRHRIFTNFTADSEGVDVEMIIAKLLEAVKEPDETSYKHRSRT